MTRSFLVWCLLCGSAAAQPMNMPMPAPATPPAPPNAAVGHIAITGAWARATAPGQTEGAAYLTLTSTGGDRLVGIDTAAAGMAMLHVSTNRNGVAEMRDVDAVTLPAGKPVHLAPGGIHIMLMDVRAPLRAGDRLHLSLSFAHAGRKDVEVPVMPIGATGP